MTTKKEVLRILRPLAKGRADLAIRGHWLFVLPIDRLVRGIFFERIGEAARFRPWWAVMPLCNHVGSVLLDWATTIGRGGDGLWWWSLPTLREELYEAIESQAMPTLRSIQSLDDFVDFARSRERFSLTAFNRMTIWKAGVDAARGDFPAALLACKELLTGRTVWSHPAWRGYFLRLTQDLYPLLLSEDRPAIARLLLSWEAYTVDKVGIRDLWQATPFPFERDG